jgi:hypothetical protein
VSFHLSLTCHCIHDLQPIRTKTTRSGRKWVSSSSQSLRVSKDLWCGNRELYSRMQPEGYKPKGAMATSPPAEWTCYDDLIMDVMFLLR